MISCVAAWSCAQDNDDQIAGYGLADHVQVINPVSASALDTSLQDAYAGQDPWLGFQWNTNEAFLLLDMVRLKEP